MEQSRFPEWKSGLDHDREAAEIEHKRIKSAIEQAMTLPDEDCVDRLQEIKHGIV